MPPLTSDNQESQIRVLVVDDQEDILHVMRLILTRQQNYCVETASSGMQALRKAETFEPDIIVSDITMPVMDGCELMTQLREKPHLHPFKSIALSGYGGEREDVALAAGYDVHLVKPVDYDNLTEIIDQLAQENV
jgi:two-component system CheB/CheR fusion protein